MTPESKRSRFGRIHWIRSSFEGCGEFGVSLFHTIGEIFLLLADTLRCIPRGALNTHELAQQMARVGVSSMPLALITVSFSAMVLALHTVGQFQKFGAAQYVGGLISISVVKEIAPVISAIVIAGRVGSSMAAELGSMKVTEQIDALRALATSPVEYLVVPRFLACVIMLPILVVFADVVGTAGGYLVAVKAGVTSESYIASVQHLTVFYDVFAGLLKTIPFGMIIATVSCHQGLGTTGGAAGVGRATTTAVVMSMIFIYVADYFLSALLY